MRHRFLNKYSAFTNTYKFDKKESNLELETKKDIQKSKDIIDDLQNHYSELIVLYECNARRRIILMKLEIIKKLKIQLEDINKKFSKILKKYYK